MAHTSPRMTVICLLCGRDMVLFRALASVIHHYEPPMSCRLIQYRCETPDCGNEVVVEDS